LGLSSKDVIENEKNLIRVSDVLVGANTLANASVLQFSEALTNKAAAAMVNLNIEVEEGVAVLAAYADKGIKGRLAGQRLTMMLNGLFAATRENKEAWDEAGISLFKADGSMREMADIIQDIEGHLGSMTVQQREAELAVLGFNIKTKDSILTLMGSSEKIREWTAAGKEMGGITKTVADKQMEAFNAKMTVLKNVVIGAAIGIGQSLAPMIESLVEKIKNVAAKISAWIEKHPKLTAVIAKLVTGIGALSMVLGPLMMMLPGIILALPALKAALASLLGPLGAIIIAATAVGIALTKLIENYKKKQDAEIDAIVKATTPMAKAMALRRKLIKDEILTTDEWQEIFNKHGRSYKRTLRAIATLPEYAHIKAAWDAVIKKHKDVEKSDKDLLGDTRTNSKEAVSLISKMVDEIKRATLNEFEYRVWAAHKTYAERKALLEKEKADKQAFILLEKSLAVELNKIEEDKTEKFKAGWAERGKAVMAGMLKWRAEEKKYLGFIATFTDIIKKASLSEKQYKIWQAEQWYIAVKEKLKALYGETQKYHDAVAALDAAYAEKRKGSWKVTFGKILSAAGQFTSALGNLFTQMHQNEIQRIENEYERRKQIIDASLMTDQEKYFAIEKLDREMDKKRLKAQRKQAKRTKALSLMEAIVNTAAAVVQAMKAPFPLSLILPIIIGAMGAAQIALIAAQPLPSFAKGGRIEEAGIVGERGPELFVPETAGAIIPLREGAGMGALRPIYVTIAPTYQISTIDEIGVRDFMRDSGLPAIVEAIKIGIMKPELQDALRIK